MSGSGCQGLKQDSGVGIQESEGQVPGVRFQVSAFSLLRSADCNRGEFDRAGFLPRSLVYDKMSPPKGKERTSNFKK